MSFFEFGFLPIVGSQWNFLKEMPTLSKSVDSYLLKLFTIVHYKEVPWKKWHSVGNNKV